MLEGLDGRRGVALDRSPYAARRAARAHPRIGAVVCDVWAGLPLVDGALDVLVCVFAPRNGPEMTRVLRPDGVLVVVTPTPGHLAEIRAPLGLLGIDDDKADRLEATLGEGFATVDSRIHEHTMQLPREHVADLVAMGPSARHRPPAAIAEALTAMADPCEVTASVRVSAHRLRGPDARAAPAGRQSAR